MRANWETSFRAKNKLAIAESVIISMANGRVFKAHYITGEKYTVRGKSLKVLDGKLYYYV